MVSYTTQFLGLFNCSLSWHQLNFFIILNWFTIMSYEVLNVLQHKYESFFFTIYTCRVLYVFLWCCPWFSHLDSDKHAWLCFDICLVYQLAIGWPHITNFLTRFVLVFYTLSWKHQPEKSSALVFDVVWWLSVIHTPFSFSSYLNVKEAEFI